MDRITNEYEQILSVCENHADIDYHLALCNMHLSESKNKNGLDREPTLYVWFLVTLYFFKRSLLLVGFYLLPVVLFLLMEFCYVSKGAI